MLHSHGHHSSLHFWRNQQNEWTSWYVPMSWGGDFFASKDFIIQRIISLRGDEQIWSTTPYPDVPNFQGVDKIITISLTKVASNSNWHARKFFYLLFGGGGGFWTPYISSNLLTSLTCIIYCTINIGYHFYLISVTRDKEMRLL